MKIGLKSPQDFLALLVRRKWWVVFPFVALSCAVGVLTHFLPKVFVSETLILVRARDVPVDFVKDLIAGTAEQRLRAIEQVVLSRTNLVQILREFGDRLPEFARLNMDGQVLKLRNQIHVTLQMDASGARDVPLTYFRISCENQSPELAQKIASKLTTLFIQEDNRVRENQVNGTTEFFSSELDEVSQKLKESEARLKELKTARQFELPDQREANLRALDRLYVDKKTNAETVERFTTMRLNIESQLAQTSETLPKMAQPAVGVPKSPLIEEYRKAEREYEDVAGRYTAKHPEVLAAKARVDRLKQQIPPDVLTASFADTPEAVTTPAREPNPVYQRLVAQLQEVKTELEINKRNRSWIESEIEKYNGRVEGTPRTEQDIADVVRQNDDLKKQYDELKGKLTQAQLAENLESKQKGSQFQVVDSANYPLEPAKPKKLMVLLGGAIASLLVSMGLALGVDVATQKVWTQSEIESLWGVPVLIDIPEILSDTDLRNRRRKKVVWAASTFAGVVAWSLCLYLMYIKHGFILQHLDPVLQKLVYK